MTHRLVSDPASENDPANSVAMCRVHAFGSGYQFTGGGCDAVCINADRRVAVTGISLCSWRSGSTSGDVSIYVIQGSSTGGRILSQRELRAVQLDYGSGLGLQHGVIPLMFEHPVYLEPANDYTLALCMRGDMVHEFCACGLRSMKFDKHGEIGTQRISLGIGGRTSADPDDTSVTVTIKNASVDGAPPNLNLDNDQQQPTADNDNTDCQIPFIYFKLCDVAAAHAPAASAS
jgi:hypothetical protein